MKIMRRHLLLGCMLLLTAVSYAQDKNFHIYLCLGQSNMEGNARIEPQDKEGVSERFQVMSAVDCPSLGRVKGQWYTAVPPLARCYTGLTPGDYFGRTLGENLPEEIRGGIINVSIGGCHIELFDKENYMSNLEKQADWLKNMAKEYDNNPYARLVELANKYGTPLYVIDELTLRSICNDYKDTHGKCDISEQILVYPLEQLL